ncbi:hypothetical protein [Streptomyces sp. MST-110588]|uniref:hypothetical protein n=1 Tax=Streptomyces sp. MST-110588 TaxID=2833628 RepID=UPI001F5CFE52|nr:hypothetical protein [Streptomyces sp. MST-110588]UNO43538.1 hypothetical protein KGS77_33765 [Streptomyces sp. MST-110588]
MIPNERNDVLRRLDHMAHERAFGRYIAADQLIQTGLDALLAGVDSPSLAMLAGLGRNEEREAPELFDQVLVELGLFVETPTDPRAVKWAETYWIAGRIADGSLDPYNGVHQLRWSLVDELGHPNDLMSLIHCGDDLETWDENWGISQETLEQEVVLAAADFLRKRPPGERTD